MTQHSFSGTYTALATPFTKDGSSIDFDSLTNLVAHQIAGGVQGLVVCGSTGEAATLTPDEYTSVVRHVVAQTKGALPIVAGIGTNSTAAAVQLAHHIAKLNVDAIMVVVPPYNKPSQRGMIEHFSAVKRATSLPLIAYNVPGRSSANLLPQTVQELSELKIIDAVKEACGNMDQISDLLLTERNRLPVFCGDDSLTFPAMAAGARGVISVVSNVVPEKILAITASAQKGAWERARNAHFAALPIMRALFAESNPVPVKAALALKKIITHDTVRLPLLPAQATTRELLSTLLREEA
jgi:4-hydroxy-tetrahydrodipicolinate synthase